MFDITTGQSNHIDAWTAGRQAAQSALAAGKSKPLAKAGRPELALVFGAIQYAQQPLIDGVADILGRDVMLIGCGSGGQISLSGIATETVVVMLIWPGSRLALHPVLVAGVRMDPYGAGIRLGAEVWGQLPHVADLTTRVRRHGNQFVTIRPYTLLVFSDITGNGNAWLMAGASAALGPAFQIVGGVASDDHHFEQVFVYYNGRVYSDAVVGVVIASRVPTAVSICHSCNLDNGNMIVTRADGNILYELDGRPAADVYVDTFGRSEMQVAPIPLLGIPDWNGDYRLCSPMHVRADGALVLTEPVPQGLAIQWMACSVPCVVSAARKAATQALDGLGSASPAAALVFSSSLQMRRNDTDLLRQKVAALRSIIGEDVPLIGFYTSGELATPSQSGADSYKHTCVIFLIGV